jgi:hypothetical protein
MSNKELITTNRFTRDKKIIIPKKFKKDIAFIREVVRTHQSLQDFLIVSLTQRLGYDKDSAEFITVEDYVRYNSYWMVKFK